MKLDPSSPAPESSEPLGYRSTASDRAARKAIWSAALKRPIRIALGMLVLLPFLILPYVFDSPSGRGRETAYLVRCAQNLRQIGQAVHLYAASNNGHYPVALSIAFADGQLSLSDAFCPNRKGQVPTTLPIVLIDARSDYLYFGTGLTTSAPANIILARERLGLHASDVVNVLYSDGSTEFLSLPRLESALESSHRVRQTWERRGRTSPQ